MLSLNRLSLNGRLSMEMASPDSISDREIIADMLFSRTYEKRHACKALMNSIDGRFSIDENTMHIVIEVTGWDPFTAHAFLNEVHEYIMRYRAR